MPVQRTPPGSPPKGEMEKNLPEVSDAVEVTKFHAPSGLLASVTRKGNQISVLLNDDPDNKLEIEAEFDAYLKRLEKLKAALEQINLSGNENTKKIEWWNW